MVERGVAEGADRNAVIRQGAMFGRIAFGQPQREGGTDRLGRWLAIVEVCGGMEKFF